MNRYYSDSDDEYPNQRRRSDSVMKTDRQPSSRKKLSPTSSSSSVTRIVVESPFGSKKCDYSIDKSQRGILIVNARRRSSLPSDQRPSTNKKQVAVRS